MRQLPVDPLYILRTSEILIECLMDGSVDIFKRTAQCDYIRFLHTKLEITKVVSLTSGKEGQKEPACMDCLYGD